MWKLTSRIEGRTEAESAREWAVEEDVWAEEEGNNSNMNKAA